MAKKENAHFSSEDWVDFAMKQASQEQAKSMQQHLDEGCGKCSKLSQFWNHVTQVASRESEHAPPESAVRHVRNVFAMNAEAEKSKRAVTIPRLVFDNLWQPALAGIRAVPSSSRQVMYMAGDISIEMRLEPEPRSERINVAGQITKAASQSSDITAMSVIVTGDRGPVTTASTNRFGEFHLTFVPEEGLRISFGLVNEKELSIPLDGIGVQLNYRN